MAIPKPLRRALSEGRTWVFGAPGEESVTSIESIVGEVSAFSFDHRDTFATRGAWPEPGEAYGQAVVFLPKSRARQRMSFAMAASVLSPAGVVHVVGGKRDGIKPARKTLAEFFETQRGVGAGDHVQCITMSGRRTATDLDAFVSTTRLEVPLPPNDESGQATTSAPRDESTQPLDVCWYPGVFGMAKLDAGTRLLLQRLALGPGRSWEGLAALDVGCGSGVIGAWLARCGAHVDMVDVDMLALAAAENTLRRNALRARVFPSDGLGGVPANAAYDLIVSNPPFHQGAATDYDVARDIVRASRVRLTPGGRLMLVANSFLPYRDALDAAFGAHEILDDDGRFRVYEAVARGA